MLPRELLALAAVRATTFVTAARGAGFGVATVANFHRPALFPFASFPSGLGADVRFACDQGSGKDGRRQQSLQKLLRIDHARPRARAVQVATVARLGKRSTIVRASARRDETKLRKCGELHPRLAPYR